MYRYKGFCISQSPSFCFVPGPAPASQFAITGPDSTFFTGPGPQFVFTSPGSQFVFTGPGPGLGPKFAYINPVPPKCFCRLWPTICIAGPWSEFAFTLY